MGYTQEMVIRYDRGDFMKREIIVHVTAQIRPPVRPSKI